MRKSISLTAIAVIVVVVVGALWLSATSPSAPFEPVPSPTAAITAAPAPPAPTLGAPTATPNVIGVNTPTTVTVTSVITDPSLITTGINLLRINPTGNPTIVAQLVDNGTNGDAVGGDKTFTARVTFNEPGTGQIQLQLSAAFRGLLRRVTSTVIMVSIYNVHTDNSVGVSVQFPADVYLVSPPSGVSQEFFLQSTKQYIGIGEALDNPNPSEEPSDGYLISVSSSQYTVHPFDINNWVAAILPSYGVNTITQTTVEGMTAYSLTFDDAHAPKPLLVIPHGDTVYEILYNSTFDPGTPEEVVGLAHFYDVLQHLHFLR